MSQIAKYIADIMCLCLVFNNTSTQYDTLLSTDETLSVPETNYIFRTYMFCVSAL